jgi:cytochrome b561
MIMRRSISKTWIAAPSIATRYTLTAQALHWLTVLLILTTLPVIWVAVSLREGQSQSRLLVVHKSLGVSIFVVTLARILWRVRHTDPPLPGDTPWAMEFISRITHYMLYALLIFMPITGYLQSADGRPVSYFGLFILPGLPKKQGARRGRKLSALAWSMGTICTGGAARARHRLARGNTA